MIIDNSWTIANMQEKKEAKFIADSLVKYGLSTYQSCDDRRYEYRIIPGGWRYPFYWLFCKYRMHLDEGCHTLYVYYYKDKDAAISLIADLEAKYDRVYTLKNMSDREITV